MKFLSGVYVMGIDRMSNGGKRRHAWLLAGASTLLLAACGEQSAQVVPPPAVEATAPAVDGNAAVDPAQQAAQVLLQQRFDALVTAWPQQLAKLDAGIAGWKAALARAGAGDAAADAAWQAQEKATRAVAADMAAWQQEPATTERVAALEEAAASLSKQLGNYQAATRDIDAYLRAREQARKVAQAWEQLARQQLAMGDAGRKELAALQQKDQGLFALRRFAEAARVQQQLAAFYQARLDAGGAVLQARADAVAARDRWQAVATRSGQVPAAAKALQHWQAGDGEALQGELASAVERYRQAGEAWGQARHDGLVKIATPDTVQLAGGTVRIGDLSGRGQRDEKPVHSVTLPAFAMAVTEATFTQFDAYVELTGAPAPVDGGWGRGAQPVINIPLAQAEAYARWLSARTGQAWRLPTEAEWEYAARAGGDKDYGSSDDIVGRAHCEGCSEWGNKSTRKVASYAANAYGIHDLSGNVWEWTASCHTETYAVPQSDKAGESCGQYVLRGGSWSDLPTALRVSNRTAAAVGDSNNRIGFRLVREITAGN